MKQIGSWVRLDEWPEAAERGMEWRGPAAPFSGLDGVQAGIRCTGKRSTVDGSCHIKSNTVTGTQNWAEPKGADRVLESTGQNLPLETLRFEG